MATMKTAGDSGRTRKPYVPPRLTQYGRFADLVQGRGGINTEPGGPQAGPKSRQ